MRLISIILCILLLARLNSQEEVSYLHKQLDSLVQIGLDSSAFPGAQILIRYKDSVIYHHSWGYHTYDAAVPVQKDDLYDMASVTKVSTGLPVLMQLYGKGLIDLDVPISKYVKSWKRGNKKNLTLRKVLSHQARLEPYLVFWAEALRKNGKYKCRTFKNEYSKKYPIRITDSLYLHKRYKKKMEKAIRKSKLQPEEKYLYSGLLFLLMPDMISEIINRPFHDYLYEKVYKPIGAKTLTYNPLDKYPLKRIIPTEMDTFWRGQLVHGTVHDEAAAMLGGISCNAGLFGTAEDLSKLFQLYLNKGEWNGEQIIHPDAVDIFTSYQYVGNRRGLGFDKPMRVWDEDRSYVAQSASSTSFGHSGFTGTFVWADPAHDVVVVLLSNRVYPYRSQRNLYRLGLRPQIHQAVYDFINTIEKQ